MNMSSFQACLRSVLTAFSIAVFCFPAAARAAKVAAVDTRVIDAGAQSCEPGALISIAEELQRQLDEKLRTVADYRARLAAMRVVDEHVKAIIDLYGKHIPVGNGIQEHFDMMETSYFALNNDYNQAVGKASAASVYSERCQAALNTAMQMIVECHFQEGQEALENAVYQLGEFSETLDEYWEAATSFYNEKSVFDSNFETYKRICADHGIVVPI